MVLIRPYSECRRSLRWDHGNAFGRSHVARIIDENNAWIIVIFITWLTGCVISLWNLRRNDDAGSIIERLGIDSDNAIMVRRAAGLRRRRRSGLNDGGRFSNRLHRFAGAGIMARIAFFGAWWAFWFMNAMT